MAIDRKLTVQASKSRPQQLKGESLTSAGKINTQQWHLSKHEVETALKGLSISIAEVKKISCLKHQVCVSYWNEAGQVCSSFFTYRCFARWQQAVEKLIANFQNISEWEYLGDIIQYELLKFPYPIAIANAIWDTLKQRWYQLNAILPRQRQRRYA